MRATTVLAAIGVLMLVATIRQDAQALNDKDVGKLVDEYVAEGTSDTRRSDIQLKLLRVKPAMTTKSIRAALGVDKKRTAALDLAVALWTPGVFTAVKRWSDGELCPQIVKLGLQRQEKDAVDYLFERWKLAATDSTEFSTITQGLKTHYVDLPHLEKLKSFLEKETDEARKAAGGEVLAFQLNQESAGLQEVLDAWNTMRAAREKNSKRSPVEGRDLLAYITAWKNAGQPRCGSNFVIAAKDGKAEFLETKDGTEFPRELAEGSWRVNIRVFLSGKPCRCNVGLAGMVNGQMVGCSLKSDGKDWSMNITGSEPSKVPVKYGVWTVLGIAIAADTTKSGQRTAATFVDGQKVCTGVVFSGGCPAQFSALCDEGELVLGPVDYFPE